MENHPRLNLNTAATVMVLCSAIYFFSFVSVDPDLWGHIKFGEDLWHDKTLPETDPYAFTTAGKKWINHEWLTELTFYLIYRYLGDAGLLLGKLAVGLVVAGLLCRLAALRPRNPFALGGIGVLAAAVISPGFMIRPQVFSFLFFSLFVYTFHLFFERKRNLLFLLPLLMAAWVNLHGGFLMGWVLFAVVTGWSTTRYVTSRKARNLKTLWVWFLVTSGAILVNPYGLDLLFFLRDTLSLPRQISEWAPVNPWDVSHPWLKLLALLFLATLILRWAPLRGWEVVAVLMLLMAAFRHERHSPFFAIMAAPHCIHQVSAGLEKLGRRFSGVSFPPSAKRLTAFSFVLVSLIFLYFGAIRYGLSGLRVIVDPETYPVTALRFLKVNAAQGNLIVPFDWGEHAIWKLYPQCKVSIDGRFRTAYPETVLRDHLVADENRKGWQALIDKYEGDILLTRQLPFFQELTQGQGPWIYVYSDPTAIVFFKENEKNAALLQRFRGGKLIYPTEPPTIYFPG